MARFVDEREDFWLHRLSSKPGQWASKFLDGAGRLFLVGQWASSSQHVAGGGVRECALPVLAGNRES
jgi:hypothetical protein